MESYGGSFYDDDVKALYAGFTVNNTNNITYETARTLLVNSAEEFLKSINEDKMLNPYLNHYPFTYKDIEYTLTFKSQEGEFLSSISSVNGVIFYYLNDQAQFNLVELVQEPYSEALAKVQAAKNSEIAREAIHNQTDKHSEIE